MIISNSMVNLMPNHFCDNSMRILWEPLGSGQSAKGAFCSLQSHFDMSPSQKNCKNLKWEKTANQSKGDTQVKIISIVGRCKSKHQSSEKVISILGRCKSSELRESHFDPQRSLRRRRRVHSVPLLQIELRSKPSTIAGAPVTQHLRFVTADPLNAPAGTHL
jgi:hypothetical protein